MNIMKKVGLSVLVMFGIAQVSSAARDYSKMSARELNEALIIAVGKSSFDEVQQLVNAGASINHADEHGNTALIRAIQCLQYTYVSGNKEQYNKCVNSQKILEALLENPRIDFHRVNKNGDTAIKLLKKIMVEMMKVQDRYIDIGCAYISCQKYFVESTKHKTPIVFIHGGPGSEFENIVNLKRLAQERTCIFYNQSGCRGSVVKDSGSVEWTLEHYVHELETFMNKLGIQKCILYGFSWGAAIATQFSLEHPEQVEKLILASPYLSTPHLVANYKQLAMSKGIYETMLAHEQAGTTDSDEYQNARKIFFSNFIMFGKEPCVFKHLKFNAKLSDIMWGPSELVATGTLKDMNLIPRLCELRLPVLLTSGFHDTMTPDYMRMLRSGIRDSKWMLFQDSAHMPHLEEEDTYCNVIKNFLDGVQELHNPATLFVPLDIGLQLNMSILIEKNDPATMWGRQELQFGIDTKNS